MQIRSMPPSAPAPIATAATASALDDTEETLPNAITGLGDDLAQRAERTLLEAQIHSQAREARLDRMRMTFDATQKEHAELLREMNLLRDMATEQMKQDDGNLKKWIALI